MSLLRKALENKLAVVPGNVFYVDEKADGRSIRLNFQSPVSSKHRRRE